MSRRLTDGGIAAAPLVLASGILFAGPFMMAICIAVAITLTLAVNVHCLIDTYRRDSAYRDTLRREGRCHDGRQ